MLTVPTEFVYAARYCLPLSVELVVMVYEFDVADVILLQFVPSSVLTCHWTVAAGLLLADAVNVAVEPLFTVTAEG